MLSKNLRTLFLIGMLFSAASLFSQCIHCSNPASPAEYGGAFTATMYQNATLQLWAAKPATAVDGRDWFKVKKAGDTTYVGSGDTLTISAIDTTCKFIAHTINNCSCGGTYYSAYVVMATITVVDSPSVPQYWFNYAPTVCSGSPTNIFLRTSWAQSSIQYQYFRDDSSNVSGSITGSVSGNQLGVTLTNKTSSPQLVRFVVRMFRSSTYFDSKSFYLTVSPGAAGSGDHCSFPSKPVPWPTGGTDAGTYAKGASVQFFVDSTVTATSVQWYRVHTTDTTYVGSGYSIPVTIDSACKLIARSGNYCACDSSTYYSEYTLVANYSVTSGYVSHGYFEKYMTTIASGTAIDIVPRTDTTATVIMSLFRDNALVTGSTYESLGANNPGVTGAYDLVFTNTTTSAQLVRYYIKTQMQVGSTIGNTYTGYITVLPSTTTAPTGNHCVVPARPINYISPTVQYIKGSTINLDLNDAGTSSSGSIYRNVPSTADSTDWYKSRWAGDTVYIGSATPVNTTVDTSFSIFAVSQNTCYWSDSSLHIYKSIPTLIGKITGNNGTVVAPTITNSQLNVCNGTAANISAIISGTFHTYYWYRNNTTKVTGTATGSVSNSSTGISITPTLSDTVTTPQKVYIVAYSLGSPNYNSQSITSVMVYPACSKWAGLATAVHPAHDTICSGDTAALYADTLSGYGSSHYVWSSGDTVKTIHPTTSGTYTVTVTNACGCTATTSGTVVINSPSAPSVTAWQSVCSNGPYAFSLSSVTAGAGGDQVQWCRNGSFDSTTITATSPVTIPDTVQAGATDTLWIRSKNSLFGCHGSTTTAVFVNYVKPYVPFVIPALQSAASDTPMTFTFTNVSPGAFGNRMEWSLDSNFTTSYFSDTAINLSIVDSPGHLAALYMRSWDTVSGCTSSRLMAVALVNKPLGNPPLDTFIAVCAGTSTYIAVPGSVGSKRYALRVDTIVVTSALGNGDTLQLSTGTIDSSETFNIIATDTMTSAVSVIDSGFYVGAYASVTAPVFIQGDTIIYYADTAWICYSAISDNATKLSYTIADSGAVIDSVTGCLSSVTHSFTVRAHAWGLPSCGEQTTDLHVEVNNVGAPVIPTVYPLVIDTPQVISFTIDSILEGANANQIEWSFYDDFHSSTIVSSPASISLSLSGPIDTVIHVRSRHSESGKVNVSNQRIVHFTIVLSLISAGLLDKRGWKYNTEISDEFNSFNDATTFANTHKWALNFCWDGGTCDVTQCSNHLLKYSDGTIDQELMDYGAYNFDAMGAYNHSAPIDPNHRGIHFDQPGVITLTASPLTTPAPEYDCAISTYVPAHSCSYESGMLASINPIEIGKPRLLEIRCQKASRWNGKITEIWLEPISGSGPSINLLDVSSNDNQNQMSTQTSGYECRRGFIDLAPCKYSWDWFTYDWAFTGSGSSTDPWEIIFFQDGKEMWSRTVNYPTDGNDNLNLTTTSLSNLFITLQVMSWGQETLSVENAMVDYVRYYEPSNPTYNTNNYNPVNSWLQNQQLNSGGLGYSAKTLENPNVPTTLQTSDGQINCLAYLNGPSGPIGSIATGHSLGVVPNSQTTLFYKRSPYNLLNKVVNTSGSWTQTQLNHTISTPPLLHNGVYINTGHIISTDVKDFITPANENLVYFQSTANNLKYLVSSLSGWSEQFAMVGNVPINFCGGYIHANNGGLVTFKGTDNNIYIWNQNYVTPVTNPGNTSFPMSGGPAVGAVVTAPTCACLNFYRDGDHKLRQTSYLGGHWVDLGVVTSGTLNTSGTGNISGTGNVSDYMAEDDKHSRIYFIGLDGAIYYYSWKYEAQNAEDGVLVRLGQNATEPANQGTICSFSNNAASDLTISSDGNTVYFKGTDGKLWYYFNDQEYIIYNTKIYGPNWNKTYLTRNPILAPIVLGSSSAAVDRLFYVGTDQTLYSPSWVNADNPVVCNSTAYPTGGPPDLAYKTSPNDSSSANPQSTINTLAVQVYPNPSDGSFSISINNASGKTDVGISIESIDGNIMYRNSGYITEGSMGYQFTWNASAVSSGIYICRIRTSDGRSYSAKMVKL